MSSDRTIFFGDCHIPYIDYNAWKSFISAVKLWKPETIINLVDWVDFYALSRFDKDPARIDKLQEELNAAIELQAELRATAPQARIIYKPGNHEERLRKWLWKHPEIASLHPEAG